MNDFIKNFCNLYSYEYVQVPLFHSQQMLGIVTDEPLSLGIDLCEYASTLGAEKIEALRDWKCMPSGTRFIYSWPNSEY